MARPGSELDSFGTTTGMENCKTVFIDTNLNTNLVVLASYTDTVSDIKDKLELQHMQCHPEIGEIKFRSLKVKRRGKFYILPDSLLVRSVFHGVKGHWYITADSSKTSMCDLIQISYDPSSSEGLETDATDNRLLSLPYIASEKNVVSEITNDLKGGTLSKEDADLLHNGSSVQDTEFHAEKKRKIHHKENVCNNTGLKGIVTKDASLTEMADCGNVIIDAVEATESVRNDHHDVNLESVKLDNSIAGKKSQNDSNNLEGVSVKESNQKAGSIDNIGTLQNVKSDSKKRKKSKKAAKIQNLSDLELETRKGESIQELCMAGAAEKSDALESDKRKEDNVLENATVDTLIAGKSENGLSRNDQANHSESPSTKELNLSAINHGDTMQDANADGRKKRKKNKKGETAEKTLVPATEEKIVGNSLNLLASDEMNDNTVSDSGIPTENSQGITVKDSNVSARVDTGDTMQEAKSEGKKIKKSKKKGAEIQDMLHLEHEIRQGESNEPFVETVNTIGKEDEGRLSLNHDDKLMLLSQSKTSECIEKELTKKPTSSLPDPSEANIVLEQKISDATGKRKKKRDKKSAGINLEKLALEQTDNGVNVSSVLLNFDIAEEVQIKQSDASVANKKLPIANGNEENIVISQAEQPLEDDGSKKKTFGNEDQSFDTPDANFAVLAKENEIVESTLAEKHNTEGKNSTKKRKNSLVSASDVQENFPVKDQKISAEIPPINEGSFPIKGANITSSEANEKLTIGNENEAHIVISQTEQTLEDDGTKKKNMGIDADFPVLEKENEILESNQADTNNKDKGDEGKKSKKKRKKSRVTESDVQENFPIKGANTTSFEANEKLPSGNENEANIVISQTERALDDDGTTKKNMGNDADCPVLVKENEIFESNQADKNNKGKGDEGKKSKKKRKKSQVTESDVQENFPIKDKTISAETKENLAIKGAHVASSQVIPDKIEENLKMVNGPAVVTGDHEINFRLRCVHEKNQCEVASGDNVKVASQSNDKMKTGNNVNKDVLPSISALSDLHNSLRSSDKQDSENKSSLKSARGMRNGDSKLNSQNLVKGSKQMVAASSHTGKQSTSLGKSSSERSEAYPSNKQDKKRDLILDANIKTVMKTPQEKSLFIKPAPFQDRSKNSVTSKLMLLKTPTVMKTPQEKSLFIKPAPFQDRSKNSVTSKLMKTPEKKNLFTKSGSIFQDNSVEDYGDDNGRTVDSDASTHDSSDSSSESGDSEGESEISHNLNGSTDGKGISNGGMLEMRKILRSSEQFKKAKLIASQSELEQDELFLDSQPDPGE